LLVVAIAVVLGGCSSPSPTPGPVASTPAQETATPTLTPAAPSDTPAPEPSATPVPENVIAHTYQWSYNGTQYSLDFSTTRDAYDEDTSRPHGGNATGYAGYAITVDERPYFIELIDALEDAAADIGPSQDVSAGLVVSFVQSLPYVPANATAAPDGYAKYPLETLADGGGDSEDTSILASDLLNEMGYDTVLFRLSDGHMAVGVQCPADHPGRYYTYNGASYFYQETMPPFRDLGDMPEAYRDLPMTIYTTAGGTGGLTLNLSTNQSGSDDLYAYYNVSCVVTNNGVDTAQNISVYFAALALNYGTDQVWTDAEVNVGDIPAGSSATATTTLQIPRSGPTQIECIASGDNVDTATVTGDQFSL